MGLLGVGLGLDGGVAGWIAGAGALGVGVLVGLFAARRRPRPTSPEAWRGLPVAMARCDAEWRIEDVNAAFTALLGYPSDIARGLAVLQLAMDDERTRVRRRMEAVSGPPRALSVRCRRVDGAVVSTRWLLGGGAEGEAWVVFVPEAREARDASEAGPTREQWQRASAALREPLMAIVGTAEQLGATETPIPVRAHVDTIARSALAMSDLLDAIVARGGTTQVPASPRRPRRPRDGEGPHVLVVEDHVVNARVVQQTLRRLGYASTLVENGAEAVEAFKASQFDAILMDCQMPVMDGYEATRRIRDLESASGERVPIVAVTAHALVGDRERCMDAGMDDYLTKPVRLEQLRDTLEAWLGPGPETEEVPVLRLVDASALAQLRDLLGEDFDATIHLFLTDTVEALAASRAAWASRDWDELVRRTHSLKSTSAYVGARHVSDLCARVVKQGRARDPAGVEELLTRLEDAFAAARRELEALTR